MNWYLIGIKAIEEKIDTHVGQYIARVNDVVKEECVYTISLTHAHDVYWLIDWLIGVLRHVNTRH